MRIRARQLALASPSTRKEEHSDGDATQQGAAGRVEGGPPVSGGPVRLPAARLLAARLDLLELAFDGLLLGRGALAGPIRGLGRPSCLARPVAGPVSGLPGR